VVLTGVREWEERASERKRNVYIFSLVNDSNNYQGGQTAPQPSVVRVPSAHRSPLMSPWHFLDTIKKHLNEATSWERSSFLFSFSSFTPPCSWSTGLRSHSGCFLRGPGGDTRGVTTICMISTFTFGTLSIFQCK